MHHFEPNQIDNNKKEDTNERLLHNLKIAKKTIKYCRSIVPTGNSNTQPLVTDRNELKRLVLEVTHARDSKVKLTHALHHTLMYASNDYLRRMKDVIKKSKTYHVGNCGELSDIAMNYLRKKNIHRAEKMLIIDGDHVFVVIDREGDLNDPTTWGKSCVILDVLNNSIFYPNEIFSKLKAYRFDINIEPPHILMEFTVNDKLSVLGEINSYIDETKNLNLIKEFHEKLDNIEKTCYRYLGHKQCNELTKLINTIKSSKYDVKELSNFEMERILDKNIKKIIKYIEDNGGEEVEEILVETMANFFLEKYQLKALHQAVILGYVNVVEKIMMIYSDPNLPDDNGFLPVHLAAKEGNLEIVQYILDFTKNSNLNYQKNDGWALLHLAAQNGHLNVLNELLDRGADPYLFTADGLLPIHLAARSGYVEIVQRLLNCGANLNYQKNDGWTLLHLAAHNGRLNVLNELLDRGADPYLFTADGLLPIHLAVRSGHLEIVQRLLNCGANVNYQKNDGWTLLHLAVQNGHLKVVEELLKRGADPTLPNQEGVSPLMLAANNPTILTVINKVLQEKEETRSGLSKKL